MSPLALGVDCGTGGLRLALVDAGGACLVETAGPYPGPFDDPCAWRNALIHRIQELPGPWRARVGAIALDGTSGTLLLCRSDGRLLDGPLSRALPYHRSCPDKAREARALAGTEGPASGASGSLARALTLLEQARRASIPGPLVLRHQADWLMGWLLQDWRWGEEGNNLRLGWDLQQRAWQGTIARQSWSSALPAIRTSGSVLGQLAPLPAGALGLPESCMVVAGSTDANAGVLAAEPGPGDGITVLGTTLVLKQFVAEPISHPSLSCHRVAGRWLIGGASNAGAGILRDFFSDARIRELSRQIDPQRPTGLHLLPLPGRGERFPVDDPGLEPVLGPRPVSDALYLQALLEGLTAIEVAGWRLLQELGAPPLQRVITLGGGARNPQWRALRQRALGVPVLNRPGATAAAGMARLALAAVRMVGHPVPATP